MSEREFLDHFRTLLERTMDRRPLTVQALLTTFALESKKMLEELEEEANKLVPYDEHQEKKKARPIGLMLTEMAMNVACPKCKVSPITRSTIGMRRGDGLSTSEAWCQNMDTCQWKGEVFA